MTESTLEVVGASAPTTFLEEGDRSPDEWASYCNAARGKAVEAIIEWGRRIQQAHAAYKLQPKRWGRTWEDWCQDNLGIGKRYADQLRAIGANLGVTNSQILPAATDQLTTLARLRQQHPDAFDAAVAQGNVYPGMTRDEAKDLLVQHTQPQQSRGQFLELTTVSIPGNVWRLGEHLLYCADSSTWESPIEPKARMAFADPPYGLTSAHWDEELYWEHDWLVDAADFVFVTPGIRNTKRFQPNMPYHWTLTYWMSNSMTHGPVGFSNIQHIELYSKLDSVKVGTGDWFRDTMGSGGVDAVSRNHRGQKPISMMVWLMEKFTDPGDWVIDPFLGSGTTLLAAEKIGRRCCGVEKDPEYCQQIIARWQEQTGSQAEPFEAA